MTVYFADFTAVLFSLVLRYSFAPHRHIICGLSANIFFLSGLKVALVDYVQEITVILFISLYFLLFYRSGTDFYTNHESALQRAFNVT